MRPFRSLRVRVDTARGYEWFAATSNVGVGPDSCTSSLITRCRQIRLLRPRVIHDVVSVVQISGASAKGTLQIHVLAYQADSATAHWHRNVRSRAGVPSISNRIIDPGCIGFQEVDINAAGNVNQATRGVVYGGREKPFPRHGCACGPSVRGNIVDVSCIGRKERSAVDTSEEIDLVQVKAIN